MGTAAMTPELRYGNAYEVNSSREVKCEVNNSRAEQQGCSQWERFTVIQASLGQERRATGTQMQVISPPVLHVV